MFPSKDFWRGYLGREFVIDFLSFAIAFSIVMLIGFGFYKLAQLFSSQSYLEPVNYCEEMIAGKPTHKPFNACLDAGYQEEALCLGGYSRSRLVDVPVTCYKYFQGLK
jgi:hypothetical protein